jgi:hypothetical protein
MRQTEFHDQTVCCGRDSALEDSAQAADARSLKEIATTLDGRQLLGDYGSISAADAWNSISMSSRVWITCGRRTFPLV